MFAKKQKIKLSDKLKLGVSGPASQSTLFKVGGLFFVALSLLLAKNIYTELKSPKTGSTENSVTAAQPEVLGAFTAKNSATSDQGPQIITYTVQKGDTLFNLAQSRNIHWQVVADLNHLQPPYKLNPGTVLKLPSAQ